MPAEIRTVAHPDHEHRLDGSGAAPSTCTVPTTDEGRRHLSASCGFVFQGPGNSLYIPSSAPGEIAQLILSWKSRAWRGQSPGWDISIPHPPGTHPRPHSEWAQGKPWGGDTSSCISCQRDSPSPPQASPPGLESKQLERSNSSNTSLFLLSSFFFKLFLLLFWGVTQFQ